MFHKRFLLLLIPFFAYAKNPAQIKLQYEYLENGKMVCKGEKTIAASEDFLLCEGTSGVNRVLFKGKATIEAPDQILIAAEVERIETDGHIVSVSRPRIVGLDKEPCSISIATTGVNGEEIETSRLEVTATIIK